MARSRNIKPAFFTNDELAEIDPLGRLLFMGLWTIADYKGDIEWREKRIKAQVLPYDECNVKELAINLDKYGFIRFYSVRGEMYINITNFCKHQNPHKNEKLKGSDIPNYSESSRQAIDFNTLTINHDKSRLNQDENGTAPADSFNPYPDSPILIPSLEDSCALQAPAQQKVPYDEILNLYHTILPSLPRVKVKTESRLKSMKARHITNLNSNLENWEGYFTHIRDNCTWMLSGQYSIDFDYVITQKNYVKILEGTKNDR